MVRVLQRSHGEDPLRRPKARVTVDPDVADRRWLFESCIVGSTSPRRPTFPNQRVSMKRKLVGNQAASYALAGLLLSMLVAFIAFDLNAVRREAFVEDEGRCSAVAVVACSGRANSTMWGVRGVLTRSAE